MQLSHSGDICFASCWKLGDYMYPDATDIYLTFLPELP